MGSSESKTNEIISQQLDTMSGPEILEAAGGILSSVHIIPDKSCYNVGDAVSGTVRICLNQPIFFVEEGLVQIALEGTEVFAYEEDGGEGQARRGQQNTHIDKFFRTK